MPTDRYLSLEEAAAILRCDRETVRKNVIKGRLDGFQISGVPKSSWRVSSESLRKLEKSRKADIPSQEPWEIPLKAIPMPATGSR